MSLNSTMQIAANAIRQIAYSTNGTAHNVANVNTPNYTPVDIYYQTGPYGIGMDAYLSETYLSDELLFTENGNYNTFSDKATLDFSIEGGMLRATSNKVDIAREFVDLISDQRALEANAKVITAAEMMYGVVIDMKA